MEFVGKAIKVAYWVAVVAVVYVVLKVCLPAAFGLFGWTPSITVSVPPGARLHVVEHAQNDKTCLTMSRLFSVFIATARTTTASIYLSPFLVQ